MFLVLFLITFLFPFQTFADAPTPAQNGEYTYEVGIMHKTDFLCGGALISATYVITAAHCVKYEKLQDLKVIAGAVDKKSFGNEHKNDVKQVISHPRYTPSTRDFDLSLLILKKPIDSIHRVEPIQIVSEDFIIEGGFPGEVVFWDHSNGVHLSTVPTELWAPENCTALNIYGPYDFNEPLPLTGENTICVNMQEESCIGDDAGSLVIDYQLVGIASWHLPCQEHDKPLVLMNMVIFSEWVRRVMRET